MPEESAEPPKRATTGRSISLPSSPFDHFGGDAGQRRPLPPPPGRQLSRALSSHLDRCMSAHSYHARGGRQHPASSSPARSSVIAAALGTRARRFSFVEGEVEEAAPLEVEEAAATLGANRFRTITRVIFPAIFPALLAGFSLSLARAVGEYGSVIFIAGNLPNVSEITPLLIIHHLEEFDYAGAAAIGLVMLLISLVTLFVLNVIQGLVARRGVA